MFKKIIRAIKSFFASRRKARQKRKMTKEVQRIAWCVDGLSIYRRRSQEVRSVKAETFCDAYRFFLRMCDCTEIRHQRCGGYSVFFTTLPDGAGTVELTDRCRGFDERVVAEMSISVPALLPQVSKIKFISTNKTDKQ